MSHSEHSPHAIEQEMPYYQAEGVIADRQLDELRRMKFFFVPAERDDVRYWLTEFRVQQSIIRQRMADLVLRDGRKRDVFFEDRAEADVHSLLKAVADD